MRNRGVSRPALYVIVFAIAVVVLIALRVLMPPPAPIAIAPPPAATQPALPATAPAPPPPATKPAPPIAELLDVIRIEQPNYPTTQPLDLPADLPDAARIELSSPVYLDGVGNLWITSPKGQPIADVLKRPITSHTVIVREKVLGVLWNPDADRPDVYVQDAQLGITGYSFSDTQSDVPIVQTNSDHHVVDWQRATRFDAFAAIPGANQLLLNRPMKIRRFVQLSDKGTNVILAQSSDTLYAWQPWENGYDGGDFALSFDTDGKQTKLDAASGWADKIIQLVPLADGSVLIVSRGENGIDLKLRPSPNPQPLTDDQLKLTDTLAHQLGDRDPVMREQAQRQLESLGPIVYPELEKLRETLRPEAQVRIETLLGQRFAPTLAGLRPLEGEVKTIARFRDGGCVLQLTGGGTDQGTGETVIPAYVSIRPGKFIQRLELGNVANFDPQKYRLGAAGEEWVIVDPVAGPQRWIGSKVFPLVDPPLADYDDLVGIDAQHRWLFRSAKRPGKTLIIDPALPDITPRLPTWTIDAPDGVGWTNLGWPAVKRGERIFVLGEKGWRLPDKDESFQTTLSAVDPNRVSPTTLPTSQPQGQDNGTAPDTIWRFILPDDTALDVGKDNTVTRFHHGKGENTDSKPEAIFTTGLPRDTPRRVWLDPAGRLDFAGDQLTITFPLGRVPRPIGDLMLRSSR